MFRLQHQFNNVVETTPLNYDQMLEFHCHCKCSKCSLPAPSYSTSIRSPYLRNVLQPCQSVPVAGYPSQIKWSASLSLAFVFSFVLSCSKPPTLRPIRDSPFDEFGGHWSVVMISGQLARSQFCALRGVARCVCWRAVLLEDETGEQPAIASKER